VPLVPYLILLLGVSGIAILGRKVAKWCWNPLFHCGH
jgi:hypothetical protein